MASYWPPELQFRDSRCKGLQLSIVLHVYKMPHENLLPTLPALISTNSKKVPSDSPSHISFLSPIHTILFVLTTIHTS